MNEESKKGRAWIWGLVGAIAGMGLGMVIAGPIAGIVVAVIIGILAFMSSRKNNGAPPAWLWRSKKKK